MYNYSRRCYGWFTPRLHATRSEAGLRPIFSVFSWLITRVVAQNSIYCHITPVLIGLHWLPVCSRNDFKIESILLSKCCTTISLCCIVKILPRYTPSRSLQFSASKKWEFLSSGAFRGSSLDLSSMDRKCHLRPWEKGKHGFVPFVETLVARKRSLYEIL